MPTGLWVLVYVVLPGAAFTLLFSGFAAGRHLVLPGVDTHT